MKVCLVKHSFFTFRGKESWELELCGKSVLDRMRASLGAELCEEDALPAGDKAVLYPAFPFLTREELDCFLYAHAGSFRFSGGYVVRGEGAFYRVRAGLGGGMFTLGDYAAFSARAAARVAARHLARGALVEEGAEVSEDTVLSAGAIVRRGARLVGKCFAGENAEIRAGSELFDSAVGRDTVVAGSVLVSARVGERCTVGPNAYLRPDTFVGNDCRIGDFVELKNARIGDGCKVAHLAYVGDAELGERVNVGCGAVFVNFDGRAKRRTVVGRDSFIGSNCNLVAPLHLGERVFVAAGTTLTRDLESGDFCIGRSREEVKRGRAGKYLPE